MLRIRQGVTWDSSTGPSWPVTIGGAAVDFTGWTGKAQVRAAVTDPDPPLYEWSTTPTATMLLANSAVTLLLAPGISTAWTWRLGVYNIKILDGSGRTAWVANGRVMVIPSVTH